MNIFPEDPRSYLRDEFDRRHKRNPSYSWRSFARDLKLSPSMLSEFLKGRYGLSKGKATAIAQSIKLDLVNTEHFIDLLEAGFHRLPTQRENARFRAEERLQKSGTAIPAESLKSVLDWSSLSMMEIAGLEQGEPVPARWAAPFRHLHDQAKEALTRLRELKLVNGEDGALIASEEVTIAGEQIAEEELRGLHAQALELSRLAIEGLDAKERESLTVFGSVRKEDFTDMRKEMNDALLQILNKYASRPGSDSVFCLALQAFPIYSKSH